MSALRNWLIRTACAADDWLLNQFGIPYAMMTRDWLIHERMRYLTDWALRLPGRLRVLDAGCGSGLSFLYLQHRCADKMEYYVGVDFDTSRLRRRYRGATVPHDFVDVDLDSHWQLGRFDLIFASEVIEHIVEDRRLFSRLVQHLANDGVLVITTPNKEFVDRVARVLPGFDVVSPVQDGGHVRAGYEPGDFFKLAGEHPLSSIDRSYLGRIDIAELRKRDSMRNPGEYVNTVRFNPHWLLRTMRKRQNPVGHENQYWSLTMAFQRIGTGAGLTGEMLPKARRVSAYPLCRE